MSTKNTQLNPIEPNITQLKTIQSNSIQRNGCHIEVTQPCIYFHCPKVKIKWTFQLTGTDLTMYGQSKNKGNRLGWVVTTVKIGI